MEAKGRYTTESIEYIAKLADGGLRDSLSLLDKCLAYSSELTLENVVKALGTVDYSVMLKLTDALVIGKQEKTVVEIVEGIYNSGKDIKQFVRSYGHFLLDVMKYSVGCEWRYIGIPQLKEYVDWLSDKPDDFFGNCHTLLNVVLKLTADIKYSSTPKLDTEAALLLFHPEEDE